MIRTASRVAGIPADEPVPAHLPDVASAGYRRAGGLWHQIIAGITVSAVGALRFLDNEIDLRNLKTSELHVKVEINEVLQLDCEHLPVPACVLGQLIVSKDIGLPLLFAEMRERERGDGLDTKQLSCLNAAVPGNNLALITNENRVHKTEPFDTAGDLLDLLF